LFEEVDFVGLFPSRGQPALTPWRLALITVMQFLENLLERQRVEAVRSRNDWNNALGWTGSFARLEIEEGIMAMQSRSGVH
jgi:transposase